MKAELWAVYSRHHAYAILTNIHILRKWRRLHNGKAIFGAPDELFLPSLIHKLGLGSSKHINYRRYVYNNATIGRGFVYNASSHQG